MRLRTTIAAALAIVASGLLPTEALAQVTTTPRRPRAPIARPQVVRPQIARPQITRPQIARPDVRQRAMNTLRMRLRANDGRLGVRERMRLHRRLNELSRTIRRFGRG